MRFKLKSISLLLSISCSLFLIQCTSGAPGGAGSPLDGGLNSVDGSGNGGGPLDGGIGSPNQASGTQASEDFTPKGFPEIVLMRIHWEEPREPEAPQGSQGALVYTHEGNLEVAYEETLEEDENPTRIPGSYQAESPPTQEVHPGQFFSGPKPYVWYRHQSKPALNSPVKNTDDYGNKTWWVTYLQKKDEPCDDHFTFYACFKDRDENIWVADPIKLSCPKGTLKNPLILDVPLKRPSAISFCPPQTAQDIPAQQADF